jgi:hypothetical protein
LLFERNKEGKENGQKIKSKGKARKVLQIARNKRGLRRDRKNNQMEKSSDQCWYF